MIHATVLNGDDALLDLLDRLIDRVSDEVHRAEMPEADRLEESRWYKNARPTRRKVLMSAVATPPRRPSLGPGPHAKAVEIDSPNSVRLAEKLAHAPLVVLVEDREADGVLLDMIVEELAWPALRTLWERGREVTPPAVEIDTAGGIGAIPQRVERAAVDAAGEGRPLRHFVLHDSDSRWPGDTKSEVIRRVDAVREACKKHDIPCHCWQKRCAENYIPDEVFEAVRDDPGRLSHVKRFNAFLRRSRIQRDHFPIKDGLSAEERTEALRVGFYDASEEEDLKLLERSLLPKKPRPLQRLQKEQRGSFTASGLRARDGEGELEALLNAIAEEL